MGSSLGLDQARRRWVFSPPGPQVVSRDQQTYRRPGDERGRVQCHNGDRAVKAYDTIDFTSSIVLYTSSWITACRTTSRRRTTRSLRIRTWRIHGSVRLHPQSSVPCLCFPVLRPRPRFAHPRPAACEIAGPCQMPNNFLQYREFSDGDASRDPTVLPLL